MAGPKKKRKQNSEKRAKNTGIAPPAGPPHQHATTIAEAVDDVWHDAHGHGELEVPVSVVAALALLAPPAQQRDEVAGELIAMDADRFATFMRTQWAIFVNARPDLVNRVWPLMRPWHGERPLGDLATRAAKRVAGVALQRAQLHLTGDADLRGSTDLLGKVLTLLRGPKAAQARGQFYTPTSVTDTIARLLGPPQEGQTVHEPAAGSGGMLRAAAQAMREHGRDPATVTWIAVDIDEEAIACLAVNVVLWGLGPRVLLGVGDSLSHDWMERAEAERRETLELAQQVRRHKTVLRALQNLEPPDRQPESEQDSSASP
ncbi:N-6 DNA methylase [Salinactinospora qingdaonensis]